MGCSASTPAVSLDNGPLEVKLRDAVYVAKMRSDGASASGADPAAPRPDELAAKRRAPKPSFNGLLMHFGRMRPGFQRLKALFVSMEPDSRTRCIPLQTMRAHAAAEMHIGASQHLNEVLDLCRAVGKQHLDEDDFIVVWAILAFLEPQAAAHFPEIQEALEILERAFLYFDSSLDGTLEREELVAALCSGTKRIGSSKEKSNSRQSSKGPKRYKGAADMLFDVLDLDKSGSITFKEFLLGIVHIVMSEELTQEDEDFQQLSQGV